MDASTFVKSVILAHLQLSIENCFVLDDSSELADLSLCGDIISSVTNYSVFSVARPALHREWHSF